MVHSSSSSSSSTHLLPLPSLPPLYALYTLYTLESLHTLYTLYTLYTLCTQCVQCVHHVYSVQCVQCAQCVQCVQNAQSAQNVQCVQCAQCVYSVYSLAMGPQYSGFVLFALPLLHEPMNCRLRTFELNCLTAYCFFSQPNCVLFNCPVTVGTVQSPFPFDMKAVEQREDHMWGSCSNGSANRTSMQALALAGCTSMAIKTLTRNTKSMWKFEQLFIFTTNCHKLRIASYQNWFLMYTILRTASCELPKLTSRNYCANCEHANIFNDF